jgi:hypothetical protein
MSSVLVRMAWLDLVPGVQFDQRQRVGPVAVHLVGGAVNERRLGRIRPGVLQQVQGADGVDVEIGVRFLGGPVVTGLAGGVDHHGDVRAVLLEHLRQALTVADVDVDVGVRVGQLAGEP